jgi:uncharacterized phosphosugar-binding protein
MTNLRYLDAVRGIIAHLESTQAEAVEKAADIVIGALTNGGAVFCNAIGHGTDGDFLGRAGGLVAVQSFSYSFNVNSAVAENLKDRPRPEPFEQDLETVRFAVRASNLRAGDVMLTGSVSGKNRGPIELAMACRDMGVKVIAFTSMEYTKQVESLHPSGKLLYEVADVVIDHGAPYGDAAVDMPGFDFKLLPVSGVGADIAGWMVWERVIEKMTEAGNPPSVFMSVNRDGGWEYYEKSKAEYNRRGY